MNMNRLISMVVRQLMNIGIRKGISMASNRGAKPGNGAGHNTQDQSQKARQAAKVTRRMMR